VKLTVLKFIAEATQNNPIDNGDISFGAQAFRYLTKLKPQA
jgi:hypothetical protein